MIVLTFIFIGLIIGWGISAISSLFTTITIGKVVIDESADKPYIFMLNVPGREFKKRKYVKLRVENNSSNGRINLKED